MGGFAGGEGDPPFYQFVEGAGGEADADGDREEPVAGAQGRGSQQDFAGEYGGKEALGEVSDAVVVVAGEVESLAEPMEEGNFGVGVVGADAEDDGVQCNAGVAEVGEWEAAKGYREDAEGGEGRKHFEKPDEAIKGVDGGPEQYRRETGEERLQESRVGAGMSGGIGSHDWISCEPRIGVNGRMRQTGCGSLSVLGWGQSRGDSVAKVGFGGHFGYLARDLPDLLACVDKIFVIRA